MASCSQAIVTANSRTFPASPSFGLLNKQQCRQKLNYFSRNIFKLRASTDESDCNAEECAPDKEVYFSSLPPSRLYPIVAMNFNFANGSLKSQSEDLSPGAGLLPLRMAVSMEWLAGEKTKVVGTFPPRKRGWTGYVEKDTAGQTNIYSVEPTIYVAEGAISSGSAGSSSDGAENTVVIAAGLAVISIAAASLIVLQVGKNPTQIQTTEYSGPSLSYYINKFKPPEIVQASVLLAAETSPSLEPGFSTSEVPQIQVESEYPPEQPTTANTLSYGINLLVSAKVYVALDQTKSTKQSRGLTIEQHDMLINQ
ncbi:hypothetical protein RJ641_023280 [Dillenia turbinata]|uniref:Uncharacterized protein n=1 Tax=Dillenia turbinata TaxID=194707 RepID=A0AAN8UIF4_9MAGN